MCSPIKRTGRSRPCWNTPRSAGFSGPVIPVGCRSGGMRFPRNMTGGETMTKLLSPWELDYLKRQEKINGYARHCYQPRLIAVGKILIYHPDEHRRYLQQHPCEHCKAKSFCDQPCQVYLQWYNARMEAIRRKGKG